MASGACLFYKMGTPKSASHARRLKGDHTPIRGSARSDGEREGGQGGPFADLACVLVLTAPAQVRHLPGFRNNSVNTWLSCVRLFVTPWTACSPPGSSVRGILQARTLEWVAVPFPRGSSQPRDQAQGSNPGMEPRSLTLQADSLPSEPPDKPSFTVVMVKLLNVDLVFEKEDEWQ